MFPLPSGERIKVRGKMFRSLVFRILDLFTGTPAHLLNLIGENPGNSASYSLSSGFLGYMFTLVLFVSFVVKRSYVFSIYLSDSSCPSWLEIFYHVS